MRENLLLVLFLCLAYGAIGQTTGSISGFAKDINTEEPLIGATVQIDSTDKGTITDLDGFFTLENIPTGSYNFTVSFVGYKPVSRFNVVIKSVGNADLQFELEESSVSLDEVVVRPDPYVKSKESPMSIQKLTTEEIVAYPGGNNDIAKVVQSFPGVSGSIGGFRNDIVIRGGAPNEVVYYLDGIEIPNINHFATQGSGGGPVSLLNVSFFEGVALNTSAFSAQYDNALSGVLQFDQRTGNARDTRANIRVSGSEAAVTLEGPLFKKDQMNARTTYIVSARRSYLQFLFKVIGLPFLPDYYDFQAKVNHKIDNYNEINFVGLGSIDDFSINAPDEPTLREQATLDNVPVIQQWSNTMGLSWRRRFKEKDGFMRNTLSYNTLNNNFKRFADNEKEEGLFFSNDSRESEIKLRTEVTNYKNGWKATYGATLQYADYQNTTNDFNNDLSFVTGIDFLKYGFFAQASRAVLNDKLTISGGLRLDANTFTDSGNDIWQTFSPRMALSYKLDEGDNWRLNASLGRYFKLPAYTVLGFQNRMGVFANQSTEYIQSDHFVVGVEFVPRASTRFNLESFYKKYDNYPVSLRDSVSLANLGGDFEVFGNEGIASVGLGRAYGVEFSIQQKLTSNFFALLSLTQYRSEYTGFDPDNYLPSTWDNGTIISFTGGYKFGRNWELGLKYRYSGPTPFAPINIAATTAVYPDIVLDYDLLGQERLAAFQAFDVRIDKKWNFVKWSLDVYFDVTNVTGSVSPEAPVYVLARDEKGAIINPRQLLALEADTDAAVLPTLGLIFDF